jgi:hypothetical protein
LSKNRKDHTEIELDSIGYASARNTEHRTKLETIVRSLTTTIDYVLVHILMRNHVERIFRRNTLCYH